MTKDGNYIARYINSRHEKWVIVGMSTSAASLIESLAFVDHNKVTSICLVFAGEFVSPRQKLLTRMFLKVLSVKVLANLSFWYLRRRYGAYNRDQKLVPETLLKLYTYLLSWKLPKVQYNYPTLLVHANRDRLIDHSSRIKLEVMFPNSKVIKLDCTHEPSDEVADLVLATLETEVDYLL